MQFRLSLQPKMVQLFTVFMISIPDNPIESIHLPKAEIQLSVLREDLNHPFISGNKLRKLKYNLIQAKKENKNTLLTFGGAYSNHIYATAAAGKEFGFKTIGVIRGEELAHKTLNPTLQFAKDCGMELFFVSRSQYREKNNEAFQTQLKQQFGQNFHLLPEGGTNELAVKGCEEILSSRTDTFDFICAAVGTGGTLSGLIRATKPHQKVLGFPALKKSDFLHSDIQKYSSKTNYDFINAYHFGGYGKFSPELLSFVTEFNKTHNIPLEPVYTGKMMYGLFDLIQKNYFAPNSKILAIHTGGLQGNKGIKTLKTEF